MSTKVVLANKYYYPHIGGIEKHVHDIATALAKYDNLEVRALVFGSEGETRVKILDGVEVIEVGRTASFLRCPFGFGFPIWLRRLKADILHFHHPFPSGEISCLLARPNAKVVVTWHSDIVRQKRALWIYNPLLVRFLRRADWIIATSPDYIEGSQLLQKFRHKCSVIPLSVDLKKFALTPKIKAKADSIRKAEENKIILFVGRLVYYKGLEYLIKAMKNIDAKLIIIGEGPLEPQLRALVRDGGLLEKRVRILKHVDEEELISYYHACELFVLPSVERSEAFGIVQLEAMACAKPVVSSDLPTGVKFVNQDRKTGLIVPPSDSEALARAINHLLQNPEIGREYGQFAKARVMREFSEEVIVKRIIQLYENLLANNHPPAN